MFVFQVLAATQLFFCFSKMTSIETAFKKLNIYSFNASSIRGKLIEFNSHFNANCYYDVIAVSESWLQEGVEDEEVLYGSEYSIFRRDRDDETSIKEDGGGVLLAVNPKFPTKRRKDLETTMEIMWLQLTINNSRKIFLGNAYIPYPNVNVLTELEDSLDPVRYAAKPYGSFY